MSQQHKTFFNIRLLLTHTHKNHPNINDIRINCCDCCLFCGIKRVGLTGRLGPQCVLLGARPSRLYSVMSSLALRARHGSDSSGPNGKKTRILHLTNCIWVNAAAESHGRLMINTPLPQLSAPCGEEERRGGEAVCAHPLSSLLSLTSCPPRLILFKTLYFDLKLPVWYLHSWNTKSSKDKLRAKFSNISAPLVK